MDSYWTSILPSHAAKSALGESAESMLELLVSLYALSVRLLAQYRNQATCLSDEEAKMLFVGMRENYYRHSY